MYLFDLKLTLIWMPKKHTFIIIITYLISVGEVWCAQSMLIETPVVFIDSSLIILMTPQLD